MRAVFGGRPDRTVKHAVHPGNYTGGRYPAYQPPMTNCEVVDTNQPWPMIPFGAPQHHVD